MIKLCDVLVTVSNTHGLVKILPTSPLHFYQVFMRLSDVHNLDSQLTEQAGFSMQAG
jgi:hypothetical protein